MSVYLFLAHTFFAQKDISMSFNIGEAIDNFTGALLSNSVSKGIATSPIYFTISLVLVAIAYIALILWWYEDEIKVSSEFFIRFALAFGATAFVVVLCQHKILGISGKPYAEPAVAPETTGGGYATMMHPDVRAFNPYVRPTEYESYGSVGAGDAPYMPASSVASMYSRPHMMAGYTG